MSDSGVTRTISRSEVANQNGNEIEQNQRTRKQHQGNRVARRRNDRSNHHDDH
ncbi:MAG: hypothetical protein RIS69_265, partial [Actinomycetota bacterium]